MSHKDCCSVSPENREDTRKIITYALGDSSSNVYIATALRNPQASYYCPDPNCRVELVPRKGSRSIPFRSEGREGFYDRKAHFAAKGEHPQQGPVRNAVSLYQTAIDTIVSLLEASDHYGSIYHSSPTTTLDLHVQYKRKKDGWWKLASHPVDILARTKGGIDIIIQVEEKAISKRYGNAQAFIGRVNQIANEDHKFVLDCDSNQVNLTSRIYQTAVVLKNEEYYPEKSEGVVLTPTETVLLQGLFGQINILDLERKELIIPSNIKPDGTIVEEQRLDTFFFTEQHYGHRAWKRFEEEVANRRRRIKIPHLRAAVPKRIAFDQQTGKPISQDARGQLQLFH